MTGTSAFISRRALRNRQYDLVDVALRDVLWRTGLKPLMLSPTDFGEGTLATDGHTAPRVAQM